MLFSLFSHIHTYYSCVIQPDSSHENRFTIQIARVNGDEFSVDEKPHSRRRWRRRLYVKVLIVRDNWQWHGKCVFFLSFYSIQKTIIFCHVFDGFSFLILTVIALTVCITCKIHRIIITNAKQIFNGERERERKKIRFDYHQHRYNLDLNSVNRPINDVFE